MRSNQFISSLHKATGYPRNWFREDDHSLGFTRSVWVHTLLICSFPWTWSELLCDHPKLVAAAVWDNLKQFESRERARESSWTTVKASIIRCRMLSQKLYVCSKNKATYRQNHRFLIFIIENPSRRIVTAQKELSGTTNVTKRGVCWAAIQSVDWYSHIELVVLNSHQSWLFCQWLVQGSSV